MKRALAIALALLAAACAQSKPDVRPPAPAPAAIVVPRPSVGVTVPNDFDIAGALHAIAAECVDQDGADDCSGVPASIRIENARCAPIAPADGNASAACRFDSTYVMHPPRRDIAQRGECLRFVLLDVEGGDRKLWAVRYTPPGYECEVPPR